MKVVMHTKVCSKRVDEIDEAYPEHEVRQKVVESKTKYEENKAVELTMG